MSIESVMPSHSPTPSQKKKKTPSFFIFYIITGVPLVLKSALVYQGLSFRKIPVHFMKDSSEKSFLLLQLHPFLI